MMNEHISSVMSTKLYTVNIGDTLEAVHAILSTKRIHHIPVLDGKRLAGIITTHDLYKLNLPFSEYPNVKVTDIMTPKVATLYPDDKVGSAAELFLENLFHAVPIVDADHNLIGIITTFDFIKYEHRKEYPNQNL